jgi:hypothetical protein
MLLICIWTSYYYKHNAATTRIQTHLFFHHFRVCAELQFESVRLFLSTNAHIKFYVLLLVLMLLDGLDEEFYCLL